MIHGGLIVPRRFAIPILLLLCSSIAFADYHYASHTGSNTYPYTSWETAADSITAAMNAASPYDTVCIGSGTYDEVIRAGSEDTCLTFIGSGIDSTFLTENTSPNLWLASDKTTAMNMCFQLSGSRTGFGSWFGSSIQAFNCKFVGSGAGLFPGGPYGVFEDCVFENVEGAIDASVSQWLIFRNNYIRTSVGSVIMLLDARNTLIENNICEITGRNALCHFSESGVSDTSIFRNNYIDNLLWGPVFESRFMAEISNNTIRRVRQNTMLNEEAILISIDRDSVSVHLTNNAITESKTGIFFTDYHQFDAKVYFNGFWDNTIGNYIAYHCTTCVDTLGNIDAFPMYATPDSYDVHLQAFSPYIDAGDPNILDVDGTRSDIGCYGGPGGCSYVYLDLAPQVPDSISGHVAGDTVNIIWRYNTEADFNRYQIYRDTVSGFTPSIHNMIAEPETAFYQDIIPNHYSSYYYKLTSVDNQHNASEFSDELAVIFSGIPPFSQDGLPRYAVISTAYPNPFNSQINIVYSASNLGPQPPEIKLGIFDIQGRVVRTLVNERKPCGTYRAIWDGKDDNGNPVASGSYLARVSQWGMSGGDFPIKITLVK
jgi:hypothetical protein